MNGLVAVAVAVVVVVAVVAASAAETIATERVKARSRVQSGAYSTAANREA